MYWQGLSHHIPYYDCDCDLLLPSKRVRLLEHGLCCNAQRKSSSGCCWGSKSTLDRKKGLFIHLVWMDVMNARFKNFGFGSKRKSSSNIHPTSNTLAPPQPNGTTAHTPPLGNHNSSSASLPMNQSQNQLGRPPSYTYNPHAPRPTSPMPPVAGQQPLPHHPPPINTGAYAPQGHPVGHPAGHPAMGGAPQPPGYGGGYGPPNGIPGGGGIGAPHAGMGIYGNRASAVEVEGAGRSKAQLIVGIDFVRFLPCHKCLKHLGD